MTNALLATSAPGLLAEMGWFRTGTSTVASDVDGVFWFITWVSAFFFTLIVALMAWFMVRYRHREGHAAEHSPHHNNTLEAAWSIIPLLLVIVIFYLGFKGFIDMRQSPDDAYEVNVVAKKWSWSFIYPNGVVSPDLHVPIDRPVRLVMSSDDVIHSLYVPAFRIKMDCVPGRYTEQWFKATALAPTDDGDEVNWADEGGFDLFCTEYCGTGHSTMRAKVVVHETADFDKWMAVAMDPRSQGTPLQVGQTLYLRRGCAQCHSIDGVDRPGNGGPSFKGYYGKEVAFTDGSKAEMDENYIRQSILEPQAKIRTGGYNPIMPTFQGQLKDDEIFALIQYIKSLNEQAPAEWPAAEGGVEGAEDGDPADAAAPAAPEAAAPEEPAEEPTPENTEGAEEAAERDA